jgi:hypothetical protein
VRRAICSFIGTAHPSSPTPQRSAAPPVDAPAPCVQALKVTLGEAELRGAELAAPRPPELPRWRPNVVVLPYRRPTIATLPGELRRLLCLLGARSVHRWYPPVPPRLGHRLADGGHAPAPHLCAVTNAGARASRDMTQTGWAASAAGPGRAPDASG